MNDDDEIINIEDYYDFNLLDLLEEMDAEDSENKLKKEEK